MKQRLIENLKIARGIAGFVAIITAVLYFTPYAEKLSVVYFGLPIWTSIVLGITLTLGFTLLATLIKGAQNKLVGRKLITKERFTNMFKFGAVAGICMGIMEILNPATPEGYYMPVVAVIVLFIVWLTRQKEQPWTVCIVRMTVCLVCMGAACVTTIAVEKLTFLVVTSSIVLILDRGDNYFKQ